jgi:hypothetical protein
MSISSPCFKFGGGLRGECNTAVGGRHSLALALEVAV